MWPLLRSVYSIPIFQYAIKFKNKAIRYMLLPDSLNYTRSSDHFNCVTCRWTQSELENGCMSDFSWFRYWPVIDDALREAVYTRGINVKILTSHWSHTNKQQFAFLQSLVELGKMEYIKGSLQVVSVTMTFSCIFSGSTFSFLYILRNP